MPDTHKMLLADAQTGGVACSVVQPLLLNDV